MFATIVLISCSLVSIVVVPSGESFFQDTKCPFPHVVRAAPVGGRRSAPAKPKRKSLGQTSDQNLKKSRVANRYYQVGERPVPLARYERGENVDEKNLPLFIPGVYILENTNPPPPGGMGKISVDVIWGKK
jgi:hypothetical protein